MELEAKVHAVKSLFEQLDAAIASFASQSGLSCAWGCGQCCFKPDIEATPLEFLPFAWHYVQEKGLEAASNLLEATHEPGLCVILNPTANSRGLCSEYPTRGLICRLFGYSARTNKYGSRELVTCSILKNSPEYDTALRIIASPEEPVPVINQWYLQLQGIDPEMAQEFLPIRQAIRKALEKVLVYQMYRNDERQ